MTDEQNAFLRDVKTLRAQAKEHLEKGAVTQDYGLDVQRSIALLQTIVATELVCVLRYTMHSISVIGITSESVGNQFREHAQDEQKHMTMAAERIDQLGGTPNFDPEGLASRSATEYGNGGNLVDMVKQNLVAERLVISHYRDLIGYFGDRDPTTRRLLEDIMAEEEDHATDMHDLFVAHEGKGHLPSR
jgi:bacterioferritin